MSDETVPADIAPELVMVNDRWPLWMAPHRAARPEWSTPPHYWEGKRLNWMRSEIGRLASGRTYDMGKWTQGPNRRPVVWDIGAEEGDMPALYASWGADVVLVEPNPKVWPCIAYHWRVNDLPDPLGCYVGLVGSECSDVPDVVRSVGWAWPPCADGPMYPAHGFHHLMDYATVDTVLTLDEMLGLFPTPDVITADIEGGEGHMLAGAERMLSEVRPVWFLSVHPTFMIEMYGQNPSEHVHDVFARHGYTAEFIEDRHEQHWIALP